MARLRSDAADSAFRIICKKIERYELAPGDSVSDVELSKELDMSRTPIREAILQLIYYGVVERTKTRVVVKAITLKDVVEMLQIREMIEVMSAKIIIERGGFTDVEKKDAEKISKELAESVNSNILYENYHNDGLFHRKIVEFSGNARLLDIFDRVDVQGGRLRWITVLTPERYHETCEEHSKILQHIYECDIEATRKAVEYHISRAKANYGKILTEQRWDKIYQTVKHLV